MFCSSGSNCGETFYPVHQILTTLPRFIDHFVTSKNNKHNRLSHKKKTSPDVIYISRDSGHNGAVKSRGEWCVVGLKLAQIPSRPRPKRPRLESKTVWCRIRSATYADKIKKYTFGIVEPFTKRVCCCGILLTLFSQQTFAISSFKRAPFMKFAFQVEEYFQDFDPLRHGSISRSQFRRCLSLMGQSNLTDEQFEVLAQYYRDPKLPGNVMWTRFLTDAESGE